ncbi:ABC transporter permease [Candidatus Mycoplasma pogonae]
MFAVVKLINSYYWRGFFGPFFTIVFPILILLLMGNVTYSNTLTILKNQNLPEVAIEESIFSLGKQIVVGILISNVIGNGLISFPLTIIEFKKTSLIKRIGSTNVKASHFMVSSLIYQLAWTLFHMLWVPLLAIIILGGKDYLSWKIALNMNLLEVLPLLILLFFLAMSMGLLIISLVKSTVGASSIINLIYLPISFLSGGYGNGEPNFEYAPELKYITYLLPTKYVTEPIYKVFNAGYAEAYELMGWQLYGFPLIAIGIICFFLFIATKKFKWGE